MIFNLKKFNDLGKCSFGTLLDTYDTEKDHIYLQIKEFNPMNSITDCYAEIKITNVKDLCNWLWCICGMANTNKNEHHYFMCDCCDWWNIEFKPTLDDCKQQITKLNKKLLKEKDQNKIIKLNSKLKLCNDTFFNLENFIKKRNLNKLNIIDLLIKDN